MVSNRRKATSHADQCSRPAGCSLRISAADNVTAVAHLDMATAVAVPTLVLSVLCRDNFTALSVKIWHQYPYPDMATVAVPT